MSSTVAEPRIKTNKAKCLNCGDVIESKHRHDWVVCACGSIFVDGGKDYLRRGWPEGDPALWIEELSEYYPESESKQ